MLTKVRGVSQNPNCFDEDWLDEEADACIEVSVLFPRCYVVRDPFTGRILHAPSGSDVPGYETLPKQFDNWAGAYLASLKMLGKLDGSAIAQAEGR